jgi:organic radical activating enzyme
MKEIQGLDSQTQALLAEGKKLPIMEHFYTIQGEGWNQGEAAYFVRVGGCDVGCRFCDVKESWNAQLYPPKDVQEILDEIYLLPSRSVVFTGGEPMHYNMDYITSELHKKGFRTYLETSGSQSMSGQWNWICLSPKKNKGPLDEVYRRADELKIIIENEDDFAWAKEEAKKVSRECKLYLQPEWSKAEELMQKLVDFALLNPQWKVSIQSHKYMRIP